MTEFNETPEQFKRKYQFPLMRFDDIDLTTASRCIVEDLIPKESLVLVWGPPKCGKSFFVFDLLMHVALGRDFRGKRVEQGNVIYIAAEGELGIRQRVAAFRQAKMGPGDQPRFYLLTTRLDLAGEVEALISDLKAQLGDNKPAIITIDTLNRTIAGSESKDEDMGAYRDAADRLRVEFGCTVIIIHHCGVDGTRPRGHTGLTGAIDAQLAVKRDVDKSILVTLEHMKDGPEGDMMRLGLKLVDVGLDDYDKVISSCVIEHLDALAPSEHGKGKKLPAAQARALQMLHEAINTAGEPIPFSNHGAAGRQGVKMELWRRYCYQGGISASEDRKSREKAFGRCAEALVAAGIVGSWDGWVWPCTQPGKPAPGKEQGGDTPSPAKSREHQIAEAREHQIAQIASAVRESGDRHDVLDRIFAEIDRGLPPNDDGGVRCYSADAGSEHAAWRVVKAHRPELSDDEAQALVTKWLRAGVLIAGNAGVWLHPLTKQSRGLGE